MPVNAKRIDLLNLDTHELNGLVASWGEPVYRVKQIQRWLYHELVDDFDAMSNLPRPLRARLQDHTSIGTLTPLVIQNSADGLTQKTLFQLADGQTVETVLMRYLDAPGSPKDSADAAHVARRTVCLSTQVGCPVGCPFCETGQAGFIRNLTLGEIVAQVLYFARKQKQTGHEIPLTNIVIMGMGEPFMKFNVTWRAIEAFTDRARLGMGARRITVSTSGYVDGIQQLIAHASQVNLAVSLHAADDALRDRLVPVNRKYPLRELMQVCREYVKQTHRRVTFEYALMDGINDSAAQAQALVQLLHGLLCHVNLIPLNPTSESPYRRTPYARVKEFENLLRAAGIPTTLRVEKGIEIAAGCGQLRQQVAGLKIQEASITPQNAGFTLHPLTQH
jgi:23S rRNA (adenine2503-C2)-methyltransferase